LSLQGSPGIPLEPTTAVITCLQVMEILHFLNLPEEICRIILQFLHIPRDIVHLDNAILSHQLRPFYLKALQGLIIDNLTPEGDNFKIPAWIINRKILARNICFAEFDHFCSLTLLERSRLVMNSLSFLECDHLVDSIFHFLGNFPYLIELEITRCDTVHFFPFIRFLKLHPQLRILKLCAIETATEIISNLPQACPNLTELNLSENPWFDDDCLSLIQGKLPKLEIFCISNTNVREYDSIFNISTSFPQLTRLEIRNCPLSMHTKIYFLNKFALPQIQSCDPNLQRLGIQELGQVIKVRYSSPPPPLPPSRPPPLKD
jgi:hypothetical protein